MKLKNRLKEVLEEKNMTQKELAIRIGVTEGTISRYISGKRKISLLKIYEIALCLGVPMKELIVVKKEVENDV